MSKSQITWNGIAIDIKYVSNYLKGKNEGDFQLAHIEIRAESRLPITNTGYKSIFLQKYEVEKYGGEVALVEHLLNKNAYSKEWIEYEKSQKQMTLF